MIELVLGAMEDELRRYKKIKVKDLKEKLYYMSSLIQETKTYHISAGEGAITGFRSKHDRRGSVIAKLGSYNKDYSGIAYCDITFEGPKENSPERIRANLRRSLWFTAEKAIEFAVDEAFKIKTSAAKEQVKLSSLFSKEEPQRYTERYMPLEFDLKKWKEVAREVSSFLNRDKRVLNSTVYIGAKKEWKYFVDTTGSRIFHQGSFYKITFDATARGLDHETGKEDGTEVKVVKVYNFRDYGELPSLETLISDAEVLVETLGMVRKAEKVKVSKTYPTILDQRSHAFFWHEVIGHRFEMRSVSVAENEDDEDEDNDKQKAEVNDFAGMQDEQITDSSITIEMDPTLKKFDGVALNGHYKFDDDGAKAQKVILVKNGRISDFLRSRNYCGYDYRRDYKSNGHGRCEDPSSMPKPRMSNLILRFDKPCRTEELKDMLMRECKAQGREFGFLIQDSEGGYTSLGAGYFSIDPCLIYKVDANSGEETLVRGLRIIGTRLHALDGIIAMDNDYVASPAVCGSDSGWVPVSTIAPRALLKSVEFKSIPRENQRGMLLPPPKLK